MTREDWLQLLKLVGTCLGNRLHHFIPAKAIPSRPLRWAVICLQTILPLGKKPLGLRLLHTLEQMGPVYIKIGQLLSTRPDILGLEVCQALAKLQDKVDPIKNLDIQAEVEKSIGQTDAFHSIDPRPIASASIAQVHQAKLQDGSAVVIKIVRPGIEATINADMSLLIHIAKHLDSRFAMVRRIHLPRIMQDHLETLLLELNMFSEARNQIQLRRNFAGSPLLYVPRLYAQFTRHNMLVMEQIFAPSIGNMTALKDANIDMRVLAHKGVETFFTQVFEHNFFHADMHPGNVLIDISDPSDPMYVALDCAIIGTLTNEDKFYLAQNILAFFHRDYRKVVDLHIRSGWVPITTDPDAFEAVIEAVCEPIFAKPLSEISFGPFMGELLETAGQFEMEIQPQLVLLQKTLLYIEGVGRQLYPELDLWETAAPFMQRWAQRNLGPLAVITELAEQGPRLLSELHRLPQLLKDDGQMALRLELAKQHSEIRQLQEQLEQMQRKRRRLFWLVGIILTGTLILVLNLDHSTTGASGLGSLLPLTFGTE
ncbi:MAG: AarF/UbiB family protein [Pseudomonadales bacterium]|jgi:ubiquinone biosynthesis protein|tara:strand:- start:3930 stop:5549 length:1620 start_codon:yes stop_codon:yes gene_type:complete